MKELAWEERIRTLQTQAAISQMQYDNSCAQLHMSMTSKTHEREWPVLAPILALFGCWRYDEAKQSMILTLDETLHSRIPDTLETFVKVLHRNGYVADDKKAGFIQSLKRQSAGVESARSAVGMSV